MSAPTQGAELEVRALGREARLGAWTYARGWWAHARVGATGAATELEVSWERRGGLGLMLWWRGRVVLSLGRKP